MKVVMLGAGPLQIPAIKELKKKNTYIVCLDYNPDAQGFKYADEVKVISTQDTDAICEIVKKEQPDVLMSSTSDTPVRVVSEVSERLGRKCVLSYKDACAVTIKSVMRERLREFNVPIPQYEIIHNFKEFETVYHNVFKQKCIIKPADNAGSRGVRLLDEGKTAQELRQAYDECLNYTKNNIVVMEEVMNGSEVSVEAITVAGITHIISITDKVVCERPYFVEIGHVEPCRLDEGTRKDIQLLTMQAIRAMNIVNSPTHTEIIVTENGPKIVEIAARLGGDFITSKLVPLSTGVNMVKASVELELGEEVHIQNNKNEGAAIRFLFAHKRGAVKKICGVEEALCSSGVQEIKLYVCVGDKVDILRSSNDRIGYILASGKTADAAWQNAKAAYEKIYIEIE